jgi:hypothetical protein
MIAAWLEEYHTQRLHSAPGYLTPRERSGGMPRISTFSADREEIDPL